MFVCLFVFVVVVVLFCIFAVVRRYVTANLGLTSVVNLTHLAIRRFTRQPRVKNGKIETIC